MSINMPMSGSQATGTNPTPATLYTPTKVNFPISTTQEIKPYTPSLTTSSTEVTLPVSGVWEQSHYGGGLHLVFHYTYPDSYYLTSPDGVTWTYRDLPGVQYISASYYANGLHYIYSSFNNFYYTSSNGISWTQRSIPAYKKLKAYYANGLHMVYDENFYCTSVDGINWNGYSLLQIPSSAYFANGLHMIYNGTDSSYHKSPDGVSWTSKTLPTVSSVSSIHRSHFSRGLHKVFYDSKYLSSADGVNWTLSSYSLLQYPYESQFGSNLDVVYPYNSNKYIVSVDGTTWVLRDKTSSFIQASHYGNEKHMAFYNNTNKVLITTYA